MNDEMGAEPRSRPTQRGAHGRREAGPHRRNDDGKVASAVLHVGGMYLASETFDPARTSVAELRRWVEDCGFHCAGQSVPEHICDPLMEPDPAHAMHTRHATVAEAPAAPAEHTGHAGHGTTTVAPAPEHAEHAMAHEEALPTPHEMMGHGGHAGMSMDAMVRDMRNRFLAAA